MCDWERGTFVLDGTEFNQELDIAREVDGVRIEEKKRRFHTHVGAEALGDVKHD